ncbi:MAG: aminotransferase class V-fold PLP-dependent enzyme, partial [Chloroflexi bacterium]|nr:aminotransferase class V-fold PLP-dependent enzyme [Chloroflexota bacterium]
AQMAGAFPLDVEAAHIDLLAITGHKSLFGPQGTGGLWIRKGVEAVLEPLMRGGTGSRSESEFQPDFLPDKYESGTPNTAGLAGLEAGVTFVLSEGVETIRAREEYLTRLLIEGLQSIPGVTVYGTGEVARQTAAVSFNIGGVTPSEVAVRLEDEHDVLCRPGLQCAPVAHRTIGTFPLGTVRLSPGYFTRDDEIERALEAVAAIAEAR